MILYLIKFSYPNSSRMRAYWRYANVTLSQYVRLGIELLIGTHCHILAFKGMSRCWVSWGALPDGWTGLSCKESDFVFPFSSFSFLF